MASITLHHLETSRSHRILWMLEELGLDYELKRYRRDPKTMRADPALKKVHPLGKSPVLSVGERVLYESGAILEYLVDEYGDGRFRPTSGEDLLRYRALMHFAEASMMPSLLVRLIFNRVRKAPLPFFVKPISRKIADSVDETFTQPEIDRNLAFLEEELTDDHFIGDELTAADIQLSYPIEAALERGNVSASAHPKLRAWKARVEARPAYAKAVELGGPPVP